MTKGKWNRPEYQIESALEAKFWYYLFRILIIIGLITGILNTVINYIAISAGNVSYPSESGILYYPYSFIGGFALGALLSLWILIIFLAIIEVVWFIWSIVQYFIKKISLTEKTQYLI